MKKKALLGILIFLLILTPVAVAVTQGETPETPSPVLELIGINANNLPTAIITANVFGTLRQPVTDLVMEDFTLTGELAAVAQIVSVENIVNDNLPFAVVLMIDTSESMLGRPIDLSKDAARQFVESLKDNDPVALYEFNNGVRMVQDYTTDKAVILGAIDSLFARGRTALYDSAVSAVEKAASAPEPRSAVVLLSDGGEFGGLSVNDRGGSLRQVRANGVPIYSIGLGFWIDRDYLGQLAEESGGTYYESPTPEQLEGIFLSIAETLRTQYIITLDAPIEADGTEYPFGLQALTSAGLTNVAEDVLRAPIPVPVLRAPESPTAPLTDPTTFTFEILADDPLTSVVANIARGGDVQTVTFAEPPYSVDIDPFHTEPGDYTLTLTATDEDGDSASASIAYSVAALPPRVAVDDTVFNTLQSGDFAVVLDIESQTAITSVTVDIAGVGVTEEGIQDRTHTTTAPFSAADLPPGNQPVTITVTSASGETTVINETVTIAELPPVVSISGITDGETLTEPRVVTVEAGGQTSIVNVTFVLNGVQTQIETAPYTLEINPDSLGIGAQTLDVIVINRAAQTTAQSIAFTSSPPPTATPTPTLDLPATAAFEAASTATAEFELQSTLEAEAALTATTEFVLQSTLEAEAALTATADFELQSTLEAEAALTTTAEFELQSTLEAEVALTATTEFELQSTLEVEAELTATAEFFLNATLAADAALTATADFEQLATLDVQVAQMTVEAQMTVDAEIAALATFEAQSEQSALATEVAATELASVADQRATEDADATVVAQLPTAEPTDEPTEVPTDEPTAEPTEVPTDEPTETPTDEPTEEPTAEPTDEPTPEPTATLFDPTATPGALTDVEAQTAEGETDLLPVVAGVVGLALLLLLLVFLRRRRE